MGMYVGGEDARPQFLLELVVWGRDRGQKGGDGADEEGGMAGVNLGIFLFNLFLSTTFLRTHGFEYRLNN